MFAKPCLLFYVHFTPSIFGCGQSRRRGGGEAGRQGEAGFANSLCFGATFVNRQKVCSLLKRIFQPAATPAPTPAPAAAASFFICSGSDFIHSAPSLDVCPWPLSCTLSDFGLGMRFPLCVLMPVSRRRQKSFCLYTCILCSQQNLCAVKWIRGFLRSQWLFQHSHFT